MPPTTEIRTQMARNFPKVSRHQAFFETTQQFGQLVVEPNGYVAIHQQGPAWEQQRHWCGTAVTSGQFIVVFRARLFDICSRQHSLVVVLITASSTTSSSSPSATAPAPLSASFAGIDAILSGPPSVFGWWSAAAKPSPLSSSRASAQLIPVSGQSSIHGRPPDGAGDSTTLR